MNFDDGKTVLIIGLGRTGQASVAVLRERGAMCYVTDEQSEAAITPALEAVRQQGAHFVSPTELPRILPKLQAAVLSPGVPRSGDLVRAVQAAHVPVYSEIEVAYRLCKAPIVAVTGTKGKSTTSALVAALLRAACKRVFIGGNIGNPLIKEVAAATEHDWVIAEVSSFQLESIDSFKPHIAVILNISADHLDRYESMEEYAQAKFRIFANQDSNDIFIANLDDHRLSELRRRQDGMRLRARDLWFTLGANRQQAAMYVQNDSIIYAPPTGDMPPRQVMRRCEIPLAGNHNVHNVMAALLCGLAVGVEPSVLRTAVMGFSPMAHRLQTIAQLGGVTFVDDSKATNPSSVMAALRAFAQPIVLIAGGTSKRTDFTEMARVISDRAKAVVVMGEAADDIAAAVRGPHVVKVQTMEEAVDTAAGLARRGDIVLLSPGCASFDLFSSAEDRGEVFGAAVLARKETAHA
ncbi:MAG: UDP-N-acetylmuramoyl-L-alanine--D-glutamate ligase [Candidatus Eremiobacteraeota bacterium]|nr:UDP-N-acetylmuramoyl-L-alanine--D-glutamate ligase [Candidatus Eremiobacteraeota bacterium]